MKEKEIKRIGGNGRRSTCAIYNNILYVSGITTVAIEADAVGQANDIFAQLDKLLAYCGSSKHRLLQVTVQLKTMEDFAAFNSAWDLWVDDGFEPALVLSQGELPLEEYRVQVSLTAVVE